MNTELIEQKFNALPSDLKKEAIDFIDFLMTKKKANLDKKKFYFTWEGSLSNHKDRYKAVDLQHQATEWR